MNKYEKQDFVLTIEFATMGNLFIVILLITIKRSIRKSVRVLTL